jgi:acetyl-CoA carboxylase alpha subunit
MEYAARLTRFPSFTAPLVALVIGAGAATGAYALIDNDDSAQARKVIVVEAPAPNAANIAGKDEAATAAAISQSSGVELRGSKASAAGEQSASAQEEQRNDPHFPASALHSR